MEAVVSADPFWAGRRVFLTGHTGFKGAWLSLWLQALGAKVHGYALAPPTRPSLFDLAEAGAGMHSEIGDVTDARRLRQSLEDASPEIVFHLAAQALVRRGYSAPGETFATNVMGTANLLDACRSAPSVRAVVVVTSDKCYENREWVWGYRESDPMGGRDPYSASKGCAELVTEAFRQSFFAAGDGPQVATARAGNVIGGGDWAPDRLVPDLLRAFAAGTPAIVRNPASVRPWQHVLEPLGAYLQLAERLCSASGPCAGAWNFGPEPADTRPVAWLADRLAERWGGQARWERDPAAHPHEAGMLALDCSKARALLGWSPRTGLEQAIDWTVEWHRALAAGHHARDLTLGQIARFGALREMSR